MIKTEAQSSDENFNSRTTSLSPKKKSKQNKNKLLAEINSGTGSNQSITNSQQSIPDYPLFDLMEFEEQKELDPDEIEKKINEFLESQNVHISDPLDKMYKYYDDKKKISLIQMQCISKLLVDSQEIIHCPELHDRIQDIKLESLKSFQGSLDIGGSQKLDLGQSPLMRKRKNKSNLNLDMISDAQQNGEDKIKQESSLFSFNQDFSYQKKDENPELQKQ